MPRQNSRHSIAFSWGQGAGGGMELGLWWPFMSWWWWQLFSCLHLWKRTWKCALKRMNHTVCNVHLNFFLIEGKLYHCLQFSEVDRCFTGFQYLVLPKCTFFFLFWGLNLDPVKAASALGEECVGGHCWRGSCLGAFSFFLILLTWLYFIELCILYWSIAN